MPALDATEIPRAADAASTGPSPSATLSVEALRCFLAILDHGGVAAAAERVGRSPAAVSMQLKKLEETIGAPLFRREPRRMVPTPHGDRLIGHARRLIAAHADALDAFRRRDLTGAVRLGVNHDVGPLRIAEILARFAATHPEVTVSVEMAPSARLAALCDDGALDLCVLSPGGGAGWRPEDRVIWEDQLAWIGAAGGDAHRRDPLPIAMASQGCAWRAMAIEALGKSERPWRAAYVSDSSAANLAAAAADLAVAIAPRAFVAESDALTLVSDAALPKLGRSRLALRIASGAPSCAVDALAERILAV